MSRRKPLSSVVADDLLSRIRSGELRPGTQLPTEMELCARYEVSRTVVREAVARLRSEGLVIAEQGRGMFVSEAPVAQGFTIPEASLKTLPETIALLELRLSVEVEAAGLCARRRSEEAFVAIVRLRHEVDARKADPSAVEIHYDYDLHLAIARESGNAFIHAFLSFLRPIIVPRFALGAVVAPELKDAYYERIQSEHAAIVEAIGRKDPDAARREMRRHLSNSLERVRALALASGVDPNDGDAREAANRLFASLMQDRVPPTS